MFWSADIFTSKKHGLAVCWLAATLGSRGSVKKLTKKDYVGVKIPKACDYLESTPDGPMPLRLTSNLLVGVARVYSQQWSIYLTDVNNVFLAIRKAYGSKTTAADGPTNVDMAVPEARPDTITVAIDEDAFGNGPFDASLRVGGREMDWFALIEAEFESIEPLSSQREGSLQEGAGIATSQTSFTAGEGPQSAVKSRTAKSIATKDSITLNERSILEELPDPWSQHERTFQDELGGEGALDFGFADDELLLAHVRPPSVNMDDVAEEVRRDHAEAARSRKPRRRRAILNEEEEYPEQEEYPDQEDYRHQEEPMEEEQIVPPPPPLDVEEYNNQDMLMQIDDEIYDQKLFAQFPLPPPRSPSPPKEDEFFFQEEVEPTRPKKKTRKRKDSKDVDEGDAEDEKKQTQPKKTTRRKSKRTFIVDETLELTNEEMRSMIESGNRRNDDAWRAVQLKEEEDRKKQLLETFLTRPILMKAPKLIRFYDVIHRQDRWGLIPTEPRRKIPLVELEQQPASEHLSENLRPLIGQGSLSTNSGFRLAGYHAGDDIQGDNYELFLEQEQEVEMGRNKPPTPQSDQLGRDRERSHSRASDIFPWHQQLRGRSHSRDSPTGGGAGPYQKYGGNKSSTSFMTLEDQQRGLQLGGQFTPEVERVGRRRSSAMWGPQDNFSPLADLPMGDADLGGMFFPIGDDGSKGGISTNVADDTSSKVAAALEKDSGAFLNYALDIMNRAQTDHVLFFDLVPPKVSSRTAAARAFYHVLTLANRKIIRATQEEPYGDIRLEKM